MSILLYKQCHSKLYKLSNTVVQLLGMCACIVCCRACDEPFCVLAVLQQAVQACQLLGRAPTCTWL